MLLTLSLIIGLLVANAFFVAAEFALVKVRSAKLEMQAESGDKAAKRTLSILANLETYLAACQLGITMASLGLGWVGEPFVAALLEPVFISMGLSEKLLHTVSFAIGFLIFSALHIIVGEQLPKTLAIRMPDITSRWVGIPLVAFYYATWPLTISLNWVTAKLLRLCGIAEAGHGEIADGDELRSLIDASHKHGHLKSRQAEMLDNLFDFGTLSIRNIMTPRSQLSLLDVSRSAEENRATMLDDGHSRYPVVDTRDNSILGVILVKDIYKNVLNGDLEPWANLDKYLRTILVVPEVVGLDKLLEMMRSNRSHIAAVVNEYGALSGVVTIQDLLEEIVGDFNDEHDINIPTIVQINEVWEVDAQVPLHDISNQTGIDFSIISGVNTLSGLVMKKLGRLPKRGDSVLFGDWRLDVIETDKQCATRISIRPLPLGPRAKQAK